MLETYNINLSVVERLSSSRRFSVFSFLKGKYFLGPREVSLVYREVF